MTADLKKKQKQLLQINQPMFKQKNILDRDGNKQKKKNYREVVNLATSLEEMNQNIF